MPLVTHADFPSANIAPRNVQVWLPDGYEADSEPYAVLYMNDGQNLFDKGAAAFGSTWEIPSALSELLDAGKVRKTIVVGVWNSPARFREYLPEVLAERLDEPTREKLLAQDMYGGPPLSEAYVKFLVEELKPFVDAKYRTRQDPANTFIMGSSMGGLVSWFALARRPDVFGSAGCLSTHWPLTIDDATLAKAEEGWKDVVTGALRGALSEHLPTAGGGRRLWFDFGTEHLDSHYRPYQAAADEVLAEKGYRQDVDVISRCYPGAPHNEDAWSARVREPLAFLLAEG